VGDAETEAAEIEAETTANQQEEYAGEKPTAAQAATAAEEKRKGRGQTTAGAKENEKQLS
jgi:hypothetical protein